MLHFGTVPFPLRLLHLNAWIPSFAGMTDEDAFARTTEFHDMQSSRECAAALLFGLSQLVSTL